MSRTSTAKARPTLAAETGRTAAIAAETVAGVVAVRAVVAGVAGAEGVTAAVVVDGMADTGVEGAGTNRSERFPD